MSDESVLCWWGYRGAVLLPPPQYPLRIIAVVLNMAINIWVELCVWRWYFADGCLLKCSYCLNKHCCNKIMKLVNDIGRVESVFALFFCVCVCVAEGISCIENNPHWLKANTFFRTASAYTIETGRERHQLSDKL